MNMMSLSPHTTSVQNCLSVPAITGPRQMTGSVSFSSSRFTLITRMPVAVTAGYKATSSLSALLANLNILGMDGPVTSASSMAVL